MCSKGEAAGDGAHRRSRTPRLLLASVVHYQITDSTPHPPSHGCSLFEHRRHTTGWARVDLGAPGECRAPSLAISRAT